MNPLAKNLLILASAGSGKTFQLSNRIIGLSARGAPPDRIVALTFTRKAAGEFTDALLTKLASAAGDPAAASGLTAEIGIAPPDFSAILRATVQALHRMAFGTMDGFFAKVVKGFQYELGLTGGRFELLEGPRAAAMADDLLGEILGNGLLDHMGESFFHAFRRSLIGKEEQGVLASLRSFVGRWQSIYQDSASLEWGPSGMAEVETAAWEQHKSALAKSALDGTSGLTFTDPRQAAALEKAILALEQHTIGSRSLGSKAPALLLNIIDTCADTSSGPLFVKFQKPFTIDGRTGSALREMVSLAAQCEFAAALSRTRAIREVVAVFDALCAKRLREKGMLGFNEVKLLMGAWVHDERARLNREAVDFRLDSRHDHWLLDEFQDTSRAEWRGLQPLIDEAATGESASVFIVGDKKQAIYAWRGGDVSLFDDIILRYGGGFEIESMAESWRSCPEVLSLVNRICGDTATLHELFGEVAGRWDWQPHISAAPLQAPSRQGHARVEVIGDWEERLAHMTRILTELAIGNRNLSCGVLLRGNKEVREVAEYLRAEGFDVIEEGHREPCRDNPTGILILHLLKWLANPSDVYSREVVAMSPIQSLLGGRNTSDSSPAWDELTRRISDQGFASAVRSWIAPMEKDLSEFGRLRVSDILSQLAQLDSNGDGSIDAAVKWLEQLQIAQNPGSGAIQVMTIHKSKGLGFDVVILPSIPDTVIPQSQYFDIAFGTQWVSQTPPKWARKLIPSLATAEETWANHQRYESFCLLYVALTRAKRGLHILLDEPAKTADTSKASLSRWISNSAGLNDQIGDNLEFGNPGWAASLEPDLQATGSTKKQGLQRSGPTGRPEGSNPSQHRGSQIPISPRSAHSGLRTHQLLEQISWIDESPPSIPKDELGYQIHRLLETPGLGFVFRRDSRPIDLLREQAVEIQQGSQRFRSVMDRVHLHKSPDGEIHRIEIFDFKTDTETNAELLRERHLPQLTTYRKFFNAIYPSAQIDCFLVSVPTGRLIPI